MAAINGQTLSQQPDAAQEPSMEDILASIRRIIASDQHVGQGRSFGAPAKSADSPAPARTPGSNAKPVLAPLPSELEEASFGESDVAADTPSFHDLDALVLPPAPLPPSSTATNVEPMRERLEVTAPELGPADDGYDIELDERVALTPEPEPLVSSSTGASVTTSFQTLADSVLLHDPEMIERLAREALRPMLKTWLDENLPSMVERLVRAEIERVARGARSRG